MTPQAPRHGRRSAKSARGEQRKPIDVYLTQEEHNAIKAKAKRVGVSVSRYLADSGLGAESRAAVPLESAVELQQQLALYQRQLVGVATNLNQLAHHANATQEFASDTRPVVTQVAELIQQIDAIAQSVRVR